ncbi:MAG: carbamoyltransferase C-terminal domain-containing protein, partial [Flammeovirgaceae bacterium]
SGSAIGMACASMLSTKEGTAIDWDVYSGPGITKNAPAKGWSASECDVSELASFLYKSNEPVVVLHGRAELGPRALGNRSILAAPGSPAMKDKLNEMKQREHYRPVSPICLERYAPEYFGNFSSDPYMLFDHQVRKEKLNEIAAVCHIDGSARLQTIDAKRNIFLADLLTKFHSLSGVPVLCNTSANFNGKGFFPDVQSATSWVGADYVWCEGTLYSKQK